MVRRATPWHPFIIDVLAGRDAGIVEAAIDGVQPDPPLSAHGSVGNTAPGGGSVNRGI